MGTHAPVFSQSSDSVPLFPVVGQLLRWSRNRRVKGSVGERRQEKLSHRDHAQVRSAVKQLHERFGPCSFCQLGFRSDGVFQLRLRQSEFRVGARDVLLGTVEGTPFYVDELQFGYLSPAQFLLDVVPAESDSFSLETSEGVRFVFSESAL